jgi:sugar phosphate isomerase/epimerase
MNRTIGFSTGALAFSDFRRALDMLRPHAVRAVELSALRQPELEPLRVAAAELDLSQFGYVAVHAPSRIEPGTEADVVASLLEFASRRWPVVTHPDAIRDYSMWQALEGWLCIENMDKRKPVARTVDEIGRVFDRLPMAGFCLDLGHARQVDTTMTEAHLILKAYGSRLRQVHISEVNTRSKHDRLSCSSIMAFQRVAECIPENVPLIIESVIDESEIEAELLRVEEALSVGVRVG